MPSSNKTPYLSLNKWAGTDKPRMDDFNSDNLLLDTAIAAHTSNSDIHLTAVEKQRVAQSVFEMGSYVGDGVLVRTIDLGFTPRFVLVFGDNLPATYYYSTFSTTPMFLATISAAASSTGCSLITNGFQVKHVDNGAPAMYFPSMNRANTTYAYIAFR